MTNDLLETKSNGGFMASKNNYTEKMRYQRRNVQKDGWRGPFQSNWGFSTAIPVYEECCIMAWKNWFSVHPDDSECRYCRFLHFQL